MSNLGLVLVIVIVLALVGAFPVWPYAQHWGGGYAPVSVLGVVLLIIVVLALTGKL